VVSAFAEPDLGFFVSRRESTTYVYPFSRWTLVSWSEENLWGYMTGLLGALLSLCCPTNSRITERKPKNWLNPSRENHSMTSSCLDAVVDYWGQGIIPFALAFVMPLFAHKKMVLDAFSEVIWCPDSTIMIIDTSPVGSLSGSRPSQDLWLWVSSLLRGFGIYKNPSEYIAFWLIMTDWKHKKLRQAYIKSGRTYLGLAPQHCPNLTGFRRRFVAGKGE